MARTKKVVETDGEDSTDRPENIPGLDLLKKEYHTGKMPPRKLVALRVKLISLVKEEKATEDEQEFMEAILRRERSLGRILSSDKYLLNKIEFDRCEDKAFVKTDDAPVVHHLKKDMECKYVYDPEFNDGKAKEDSIGRYYVYVPRVIPTEYQLSNATALKELKGHPTDPSEYPAPKILIHRLALKKKEFERWFEVEDEDILNPEKSGPVYTF